MSIPLLRFTMEDSHAANDLWGANCGPGAIAAITGKTLDEVRPFMGDFEKKHYTNPTLMWEVLNKLGVKYTIMKGDLSGLWPAYGLARIQWEGHGQNPEFLWWQDIATLTGSLPFSLWKA